MNSRANRKTIIGIVSSVSGQKSVKVEMNYKKPHPLYHKEVSRQTVVHAHDEESKCRVGDRVELMQTRPISRMKRWRIIKIIEAAPIAPAAPVKA